MTRELTRELEARTRAIILRLLQGAMHDTKEIAMETPILGNGLGLDSLEALSLVTEIEAEFEIFVNDEELTMDIFENVGTLVEYVRNKLSGNNSSGDVR